MQAAWKVGALVVVFAGMLIGVFAFLNASIFSKPTSTYYVEFTDAGGLNEGADVLLAGVSIGRVEEVRLLSTTSARATLRIDEGVQLDRRLVAVLPTGFISLGDRQVLLQPGREESGTYQPNDPSDLIPGQLQGPLEGLLPDTGPTLNELNKTLVAFQELLQDDELKNGLKDVMASAKTTSDQFGRLAGNLNGTLDRNRADIDAMLDSMVAAMNDVQSVTAELNRYATSGQMQAQVDSLLSTMNSAAQEGEALVRDLRAYTTDPEIQANLKKTLANFEAMSESGTRIAQDAETMTKNGIEISEKTSELMTRANKIAADLEELIGDVKGAVGRFSESGGTSFLPKIGVEGDLVYQSGDSQLRADVNLRIPAGKDDLIFGLYDAFESNKLTAMFEKNVNDQLDLRYGVYASKPGVGVSYAIAPATWIESQLFGLNDARLDVRLRHRFGSTVHGWFGLENVFGRTTPAIGVGIRQ